MTADVWVRYPGAARGEYGDSADLCARLVGLICDGTKTATCSALRDFEAAGEAIPQVGDIEVVLDWHDVPRAVVRMIDVTVQRFDTVGEDFALAEGENTTHAQWAEDHRAYFARNGGWSPDMLLLCQRFERLEVL